MSQLHFKQQLEHIDKLCKESLDILSSQKEKEIKELVSDFKKFWTEYEKQTKLTVAFIGQYNAGKSSTIAALTGAKFSKKYYETVENDRKLVELYQIGEKEIKVGSQIMTDKTENYQWKEVLLIDTPGIYAGRAEHDEVTLDMITKSDLLVFVISNELFNPESGKFFRKVANEMQRVGQMMLVVNKMTREPGTPENLLKSILEVIEPYHSDDFYTCFIDADSYLKAVQEKDEEEKQFLTNESRFNDFLVFIQKLIVKNRLSARLTTPLHRTIDMLEEAYNLLSVEDKASLDSLEILRRKTIKFRHSRTRLQNHYHSELNKLEYEICIRIGEKVAGKVNGKHDKEEIDRSLKEAESEIVQLSDKTVKKLEELIGGELSRLQDELEVLIGSPLGRKLKDEFEVKKAEYKQVENVLVTNQAFSDADSDSFKDIVSNAKNSAPKVLSGVSQFTSKLGKDTIKGTLKFFKGKLKPWEAVNATKFINGPVTKVLQGAGAAVGGIFAVVDIISAIKEEKNKQKYEGQLREARAEIRQDFRKAAFEMCNEYEENIKKDVMIFYNEEFEAIEKEQQKIRNTEKSKTDLVNQIEQKIKEIKQYISGLCLD